MAYYLVQAAYTAEACAALLKKPENRQEAVRAVVERMGGRVEGFWFAFGEYDVVLICQMPNNVTAAAFSMTISAGGAAKAVKTTPLMTMEEGMEAMKKGAEAGYRPPGS